MKNFKKFIALFMIAILVFSPTINASNSTYTYKVENIEIKISHSGLNEEKLLHIAQLLSSENQTVETQTYGLICTLFDHQLTMVPSEVITHMVYDTYPHCKCEYYNVYVCDRCDYMETELISTTSVGCCVE